MPRQKQKMTVTNELSQSKCTKEQLRDTEIGHRSLHRSEVLL